MPLTGCIVTATGNDTTQARHCSVLRNTMVGIGTILASAGGVFITSASNITVGLNNISECARLGSRVLFGPKQPQSYNMSHV